MSNPPASPSDALRDRNRKLIRRLLLLIAGLVLFSFIYVLLYR